MASDPRALLSKAEKAYAGAGAGLSFFGGRQEKYENAADLYSQASSAFKMQKDMISAGRALEQAASIQKDKLNEPDDAANTYTDAFKAYRKDAPADAVRVLQMAIDHYTRKGNFRRAATQQQSLAETLELELGDNKKAIEAYQTAASWFSSDNAEALSNKLLLKAADLAALEADYYLAIKNYEGVAKSSIDSSLMKYSVKEYLLKAGICHLAQGDTVATSRALSQYKELDPQFANTRENQLLINLLQTVEAGEQEAFADHLYQYDQMSPLDKWKTTLLLRVKESIEEKGEDFS